VLTRLPDVQVRTDKREPQRQTVTADGLGQADHVRLDAGGLDSLPAACRLRIRRPAAGMFAAKEGMIKVLGC
jgi:hypothetical protein